jgi:glutamate synthase domain-containing protein 1/glutamate synthase domain-containing protein 3
MSKSRKAIETIINSRAALRPEEGFTLNSARDDAAEGGCGVIGIACSERIAGRHLLQALDQMRNRGNGKGGGIAAVGLVAEEFGVTQEILNNDYLLVVAYLDPASREEVERKHIYPTFEVDHTRHALHLADYRILKNLEIEPPEVYQYFVRVKSELVENWLKGPPQMLRELSLREIEDEIVYQNTYRLNKEFYASLGETRAFVLSHGKNILVLKMVGYGEDVVRYYQLEDVHAHVWIGHHRYPTKGRVWHPGGAHPFVGLNEALVHNGDFANYASISEYLAQRNIYPLFLTDTEVSVLVFDLLYRTYGYPLEYVIEALAPTTELDFAMLPPEKKRIYKMLQVTHMHCSPDGPWFFLIAQSDRERDLPVYRLTGITDTSMLRPQVFAWQESGEDGPAIGFAASEKQAIDAALISLSQEEPRFWSRADRYWNARGGSHTDGGAFIFSVYPNGNGSAKVVCTDKFGRRMRSDLERLPYINDQSLPDGQVEFPVELSGEALFEWTKGRIPGWRYDDVLDFLSALEAEAGGENNLRRAIETLTLLIDRRYPTGHLRRSSLLSLYDQSFERLMESIRKASIGNYVFQDVHTPYSRVAGQEQVIVIDGHGYPPEGEQSLALEIVRLYKNGFRNFIVYHTAGHRFIGNGIGPDTQGSRIDVYGSSGDYLGSGIDGLEIYVHGNAQDQLAQIMKSGKLVVYGDVGQTFGYAAKGGDVYILGNAAGRPMINAVGRPKVVINGTCLDYLAESFMAGNPHNGGGFVVLNGVTLTDEGEVRDLESPYPGGNLFSLASGGAIFIRDPHHKVTDEQLNGGEFLPFEARDWKLILPHLEENARLFDIPVEKLLEMEGKRLPPEQVYRKIVPLAVRALQAEEAWVEQK